MLSHILLHCSDALCMKLRIYKGKHDKYCTSFTLFFNNLYCMNCIYNVVVVVVVVENKFQFNSISYHILKGLRSGEQICDCEMYNFVLMQLHQVKLAISIQWQLPTERLINEV